MNKLKALLSRSRVANHRLEAELHYAGQIDNTREMLNLADDIVADLNTYLIKATLLQESIEPSEHIAWAQTQRNAVMEVQAGCVALEQAQRHLLSTYVRFASRIHWVHGACWTIWLVAVLSGYTGIVSGRQSAITACMFVVALLAVVADAAYTLIRRRLLRNSEQAVNEQAAAIQDAYARYQTAKREGPHP